MTPKGSTVPARRFIRKLPRENKVKALSRYCRISICFKPDYLKEFILNKNLKCSTLINVPVPVKPKIYVISPIVQVPMIFFVFPPFKGASSYHQLCWWSLIKVGMQFTQPATWCSMWWWRSKDTPFPALIIPERFKNLMNGLIPKQRPWLYYETSMAKRSDDPQWWLERLQRYRDLGI